MRFLCSSGSNNQRRMRREQSKTSHSGGEETEKQKGTARGRFSPERTHQNHRFPLGFSCFHQTRRFCARAPAAKNNTKQNQNRGPKVGVRHLLGAPQGFLEGHWLFKTMVFAKGTALFFKRMNKTPRCTPKRSQKTPHDKAQQNCAPITTKRASEVGPARAN